MQIPGIIDHRYKHIRELGKGGMGKVLLVEDMLYGSSALALKFINRELADKKEMLHSFQNEFRAMTRLKHPNLVKVFDFGFDPSLESYYITMEYVDGVSLSEKKEKDSILPADLIISITVDLCRAVSFIHSRGIIHRDINLNNTMIQETGRIKVMDFGLVDLDAVSSKSKGTLRYMAPESFTVSSDQRSDIFCIGICLYNLLASQPFYDLCDNQTVIRTLRNKDIYHSHLNQKLAEIQDARFCSVLKKLLTFDPSDRFQSGVEVIDAMNVAFSQSYAFETDETKTAYVLGSGFVGREGEMKVLQTALDDVQNDTILWVRGTAGVGKSRLFYEFKNHCQLHGYTFLEGSCYEKVHKQFHPFLSILNELLLKTSGDVIRKYGPELKKMFPDHFNLREIQQAPLRSPRIDHEILCKSIAQFILACARNRNERLVFYLNDMQWSDDGCIEILDLLLQSALQKGGLPSDAGPLHLFISSRTDGIDALERIRTARGFDTLHLNPLKAESVREYFMAVFGENNLGTTLRSESNGILERVGGNPFFLQELVRSLIARNAILRTKDSWELVNPLESVNMPKNLEDLITYRLEKFPMSSGELETLRIIALLNRPISLDELHQITPVSIAYLQRLQHYEIVCVKQVESTIVYEIFHKLIRECIISGIPGAKTLHEHIAVSLERIYGNNLDPVIEELTHHYFNAGDREKTIEYARGALKKTQANYENEKALKYSDLILDLLPEDDTPAIIDILMKKSETLNNIGKVKNTLALCKQAATLAERINDNLAKGGLYCLIAHYMLDVGELSEQSITYLDQAIRSYEAAGNYEGISDAYMLLGYAYYFMEKEYDKAAEYLDKGLAIAEKHDIYKSIAWNLSIYAQIHEARGDFDKALESIKKTIRFINLEAATRKREFKRSVALYYGLEGFYYACAGDYPSALQWCDQQIALTDSIGATVLKVFGLIKKADVLFMSRRYDEAKKYCDEAQGLFGEIDDHEAIFMGGVVCAKVDFALGKKIESVQKLKEMLDGTRNKYETAKLCYELWVMTNDPAYRQKGIDLYREITVKTKNWLYLKRLKDLESAASCPKYPSKKIVQLKKFRF